MHSSTHVVKIGNLFDDRKMRSQYKVQGNVKACIDYMDNI